MMIGTRVRRLCLALLAALWAAVPAAAQPEISNDEAVRRDAQSYAAATGVSLDEAVRRMGLQQEIGALSARLEEGERETFAGLWIEHGPEFHVVAAFTRNGAETLRRHVGGGPLASLVRPAEARVPLARLEEIQRAALQSVMAQGIRAEAGLDVRNNHAEVYVLDRRPVDAAAARGAVRLPEHARVVQVPALSEPEVDITGGLALSTCTSGFAVQNSAGTRGVTTASHCGNTQARSGTNLPFVAEAYGSYYDVQWHTASAFTVRPVFFDGSSFRNLTAVLSRSSQALNSYVCKHGMTTGYTCGYLIDKNYQRTTTTVTFTNTWMRVQGGTTNLSEGGDSGGPGSTATRDTARTRWESATTPRTWPSTTSRRASPSASCFRPDEPSSRRMAGGPAACLRGRFPIHPPMPARHRSMALDGG